MSRRFSSLAICVQPIPDSRQRKIARTTGAVFSSGSIRWGSAAHLR